MPFNFGPIEVLFILAAWVLPLVVLVWFIRAVASMRDSLQRIADQIEKLNRGNLQ